MTGMPADPEGSQASAILRTTSSQRVSLTTREALSPPRHLQELPSPGTLLESRAPSLPRVEFPSVQVQRIAFQVSGEGHCFSKKFLGGTNRVISIAMQHWLGRLSGEAGRLGALTSRRKPPPPSKRVSTSTAIARPAPFCPPKGRVSHRVEPLRGRRLDSRRCPSSEGRPERSCPRGSTSRVFLPES